MHTKKKLIIDFAGQWGAGKTYVKNRILKHLSETHKCCDLSDYILSVKDTCDFLISSPLTCIASVAFIAECIPKNYSAMCRLLRIWFNTQIKIKKAASLEHDFFFVDEGVFQRFRHIRSLSIRKKTFEKIPDFIKRSFFYPDLTIFITTDFDISEKRRLRRDSGKKKFRKKALKTNALKTLGLLGEDLLAAQNKGFIKTLTYNNNIDGQFDISLLNKIHGFYQMQETLK